MRGMILAAIVLIAGIAAVSRQIAAEVEAATPVSPVFVTGNYFPPQP